MNIAWILLGFVTGILASFMGVGGGFLLVPILLHAGLSHEHAVGTSFLSILIISVSALTAHHKLANVDYKMGLLLGIGGVLGVQIGAKLTGIVSQEMFKKIFAILLIGMGISLLFKK